MVLGDCVNHAGIELAHSPRAILKRQIDRARDVGLTIKMGSELEFYIFDESYEAASDKDYQDLQTIGRYIEDYHIFQTTKEEFLIRAIRNGMEGAAVPVEFSKGERKSTCVTRTRLRWPTDTSYTRTVSRKLLGSMTRP